MLEKIAEMVSAEDVIDDENGDYPCELCAHFRAEPDCYRKLGCPQTLKERRLMLARWAVLLVARALEKWVAEIDRTNGVDLGDVEALGSEFMDLYYEVKKAEAKEGEE